MEAAALGITNLFLKTNKQKTLSGVNQYRSVESAVQPRLKIRSSNFTDQYRNGVRKISHPHPSRGAASVSLAILPSAVLRNKDGCTQQLAVRYSVALYAIDRCPDCCLPPVGCHLQSPSNCLKNTGSGGKALH